MKFHPGVAHIIMPNLSDISDFTNFIGQVHRAEFDRDLVIFMKAIRATLMALGYSEDFVEGDFREAMELYFKRNGFLKEDEEENA